MCVCDILLRDRDGIGCLVARKHVIISVCDLYSDLRGTGALICVVGIGGVLQNKLTCGNLHKTRNKSIRTGALCGAGVIGCDLDTVVKVPADKHIVRVSGRSLKVKGFIGVDRSSVGLLAVGL